MLRHELFVTSSSKCLNGLVRITHPISVCACEDELPLSIFRRAHGRVLRDSKRQIPPSPENGPDRAARP
ncbi:hypothetical protein C8Q79DRAFT_289485 [Trametes meyenii]|nr:hypothetical protein C8Q79DRAFT_289485 [Trametes meyenii]